MSSLIGSAADISLSLHHRTAQTNSAARTLSHSADAPVTTDGEITADDTKAREAADKFEALLIHNMLKSMRKTTMTENKSNDRAIYDDMLDEKLADTMIRPEELAVADQIVTQIRQQSGSNTSATQSMTDAQRLRELATHIQRPASSVAAGSSDMHTQHTEDGSAAVTYAGANPYANTDDDATSIGHLRLAASLWSGEQSTQLDRQQHDFVKPLMAHARRNARLLGTSPAAILAIAALETGWGHATIKDENGIDSHNLFGIKATDSDNDYATTLTTEYVEGSPQKLQARFKTYDSDADAVDGFADFILTNPRYSNALQHAGDPERFLHELQGAGYATDPRYAEKAISIMRQIARNPPPL